MSGQATANAHIPMPGGAVLYKTTNTNLHFWHLDWLGSARLGSTVGTRTYTFDRGFTPYGETMYNFGLTTEMSFTGDLAYLQSAVLFDTSNRELNPSQVRWTQPVPARAAWNLYAYPTNPNSAVDPNGLAMLNIEREAGTPISGDAAMQQEAEWDSLGIGTVTADQYQNPADDQSGAPPDCWCLGQRWRNMRNGMGLHSDVELQRFAADDVKEMSGAGYLIGGVKVEVALRGKSATEIFKAYEEYQDAKDQGKLELLPAVVFAADQIQAKFKHAGDFGVNGNYNKTTAAEYEKALHDHLADPDTQYIDGTYRKEPVDIYYNSRTGNAMFADKSGNYISGWRLSPDQTTNLLTNGNVQ